MTKAERMAVQIEAGLHPLGRCEKHSHKWGLFANDADGCKDFQAKRNGLTVSRAGAKCGKCRNWHYAGLAE